MSLLLRKTRAIRVDNKNECWMLETAEKSFFGNFPLLRQQTFPHIHSKPVSHSR